MKIIKAKLDDLSIIYSNLEKAISFMRSYGNYEQWNDEDDIKEGIINDIKLSRYYVIKNDFNEIIGSFMFTLDEEPTYKQIDGKWLNNEQYGVIHRIMSSKNEKGILSYALDYCFNIVDNIRIDTHIDNKPMRHLLEKYGFTYCGVITLKNKQKRNAYQKNNSK